MDSHVLTLAVTGSGTGSAFGDGIYSELATAYPAATPGDHSVFAGWRDDCSDSGAVSPASVLMNADKHCTANFGPDSHTLTLLTGGSGSGTATAIGGPSYVHGTMVSLISTPADDHQVFTGWSGDEDCSNGLVTMNQNLTCTASFELDRHTLTLYTAGSGSGAVSADGLEVPSGAPTARRSRD